MHTSSFTRVSAQENRIPYEGQPGWTQLVGYIIIAKDEQFEVDVTKIGSQNSAVFQNYIADRKEYVKAREQNK